MCPPLSGLLPSHEQTGKLKFRLREQASRRSHQGTDEWSHSQGTGAAEPMTPSSTQETHEPSNSNEREESPYYISSEDESDEEDGEVSTPSRLARAPQDTTPSAALEARQSPGLALSSLRSNKTRAANQIFLWDRIHRHALELLIKKFRCTVKDAVHVFNVLFEDDIKANGLSHMSEVRFAAQIRQFKQRTPCWREALDAQLSTQDALEVEKLVIAITKHVPLRCSPSSGIKIPEPGPLTSTTPPLQSSSSRTGPSRHISTGGGAASGALVTLPKSSHPPRNTYSAGNDLSAKIRLGARLVKRQVNMAYQYEPVCDTDAHPPLPALFYRYYDDNSLGINGVEGFVAGLYQFNNGFIPPPPKCDDARMLPDVENHLNRNPVNSPFISVATDLFWVIRLAMKRANSGGVRPRLSLINSEIAGIGKSAYYAPPYHKQLTRKRVFDGYAFRYHGTTEFLIWAHIPPEAIIHDLSVDDIRQQIVDNPVMAQVMQLDHISKPHNVARVRKYMEDAPVSLDTNLTASLANLLRGFGMDAFTPSDMIAKLVADFIRGWKITLEEDSFPRWKALGMVFAYAMTENTRLRVEEKQLNILRDAFLCGLRSGVGELNWQYREERTRKMARKATQAGLIETDAVPSGNSTEATNMASLTLTRTVENCEHMNVALAHARAENRRSEDEDEHEHVAGEKGVTEDEDESEVEDDMDIRDDFRDRNDVDEDDDVRHETGMEARFSMEKEAEVGKVIAVDEIGMGEGAGTGGASDMDDGSEPGEGSDLDKGVARVQKTKPTTWRMRRDRSS